MLLQRSVARRTYLEAIVSHGGYLCAYHCIIIVGLWTDTEVGSCGLVGAFVQLAPSTDNLHDSSNCIKQGGSSSILSPSLVPCSPSHRNSFR